MPAKGEIYAKVDVDLGSWAEDYMEKMGINKAELARRLGLNRGRLTQMAQGKINTMKYLEIVVDRIYQSNARSLMKYATTKVGRKLLREMEFRKSLSGKKLKLYDRVLDKAQKMLDQDDLDSLEKWLKEKK